MGGDAEGGGANKGFVKRKEGILCLLMDIELPTSPTGTPHESYGSIKAKVLAEMTAAALSKLCQTAPNLSGCTVTAEVSVGGGRSIH